MNIPETAAVLREMDDVLILTHVRPDGDTIGSAAALCQCLRDLGKIAYVLYNPQITATYAPYAAPYWAPEGWEPRHVVSADIAALNMLPLNGGCYENRIDLQIDHHPSRGAFAPKACIMPERAACGEILYEIISELSAVTPTIARLLYVAISTDTGCFVYANTTADTHRIAAALLPLVEDIAVINKSLFRTKSKVRLAMESRMVAEMELYDHDRVVVMKIPLSLCQELHSTEADIEELSSLAPQVEGTDCGVTLRELKPGVIKLSLRTGPRVNACTVCRALGGGGHAEASGATVEGTMEEVKARVLQVISEVAG